MQTMRFAEGYNPPSRLRPGSLGLTLLTTGLFVTGLMFLNPKVARIVSDPIHVINVLPDPPPPKPQPKPVEHPQPKVTDKIFVPPPPLNDTIKIDQPPIDFTDHTPVTFTPPEGSTGTVIKEQPKPPVLVGANVDPRYAGYFQPAYPPDEIRAGNTGRVTVRVLIGVDGRVKDVEKVSAASDSFWEATRRQALAKWRFKPATRDGVAYETWKTMNVSFVLNQDQ